MTQKHRIKRKPRTVLSKKQTNPHVKLTRILNEKIAQMDIEKDQYVQDPKRNFIRNRKCTFKDVIAITLSMGGSNISTELYDYYHHLPKQIPSASAFVQQRSKLKTDVFEHLFHQFNGACADTSTYKGYKLYAVDGTDLNVVHDETAPTYVKNARQSGDEAKGYNQLHCNMVYDLLDHTYVDAEIQPKPQADERKAFTNMLNRNVLETKTIFMADRGYPSWNVFTHFKYTNNADFLIRYPNDQSTLVRNLPMDTIDRDEDLIITTNTQYKSKPGYCFIKTKKNVMKKRAYSTKTRFVSWDFKMFERLNLRVVRFKITKDTYETIITSLPRDDFPIKEIKKLYELRWGIETSFRDLKYTIGLSNLHARKDDFVKHEIFAALTMYNLCSRICSSLRIKQNKSNTYEYQIDFKMGVRICIDFFRNTVKASDFYELIAKHLTPVRPGRSDSRKIRPKSFVSFSYRVA